MAIARCLPFACVGRECVWFDCVTILPSISEIATSMTQNLNIPWIIVYWFLFFRRCIVFVHSLLRIVRAIFNTNLWHNFFTSLSLALYSGRSVAVPESDVVYVFSRCVALKAAVKWHSIDGYWFDLANDSYCHVDCAKVSIIRHDEYNRSQRQITVLEY